MRITPRQALLFVVCASIVSAQGVDPFPGEKEKWLHLRSPHFELYTAGPDRAGRETLYRLEIMRAVFFGFFQMNERLPLELTVFRFNRDRSYDAYRPDSMGKKRRFGGLYINQPDRATVLLGPQDDDEAARHVVNHEFIHHLLHVTEEDPPLWFNEGVADLLATLELKRDKVIMGRPRASHVVHLRYETLMPLEQLFGVHHGSHVYTSGEHTGLFYAQSWCLLHYLAFGDSGIPNDRAKLFLKLAQQPSAYENPEIMPALVADLLGMSYADLLERLRRYVVTGRYGMRGLPAPEVPARETYTMRKVSAEEMHMRLAELAVRVNGSPLGRLGLLHAIDRLPEDARLYEVLGSAALRDGDQATARDYWQQAINAGTQNAAVFHTLGQMEGRRWFGQFDPYFRMRPEHADALRDLLERSIAAAPNQSAAYELLAWVEGTALEPDLRNANLVQSKFPTLMNKPRALLGLILLRVHRGEAETALNLLDELDQMKPDHWVAQNAERVRARLEKREARRLPAPEQRANAFRIPSIQIPDR